MGGGVHQKSGMLGGSGRVHILESENVNAHVNENGSMLEGYPLPEPTDRGIRGFCSDFRICQNPNR